MCREEYAKALDRAVFPGLQGGPHQHQTAAIAVTLGEALTPAFGEYAHQVVTNAKVLADALLQRDFTLVSGGTDNHLILLDMASKGLSGKEASTALIQSGIVTNANTIPFDPRKPFDPSGVRIGTPAVTSRGLRPEHMDTIAQWLDEVVSAARRSETSVYARVRSEVRDLMAQHPAPGCKSAPVMSS